VLPLCSRALVLNYVLFFVFFVIYVFSGGLRWRVGKVGKIDIEVR